MKKEMEKPRWQGMPEVHEEEKKFSKQLIGKTVVSKSGKRFGEDMII